MSYVYFIQSGYGKKPPIKIGVAENIDKRLLELQPGNPEELKVVASIKCANRMEAFNIESYLHRQLSKRKIRGEWFASCMRRIDKVMSKWYTNKKVDFKKYRDNDIDNELDMACLNEAINRI